MQLVIWKRARNDEAGGCPRRFRRISILLRQFYAEKQMEDIYFSGSLEDAQRVAASSKKLVVVIVQGILH